MRWLLALCSALLWPAACATPPGASVQPPAASDATSSALAAGPTPTRLETIKVGIPTRGLSALPMYVMDQRGLATEEGLAVEIVQLRGGASLPALLNGELDYNGGWGANSDGIAQGAPIKLLAFAVDRPMHWVVVRPEIASLADLRGKRVAVGRVGGTDGVILSAALASVGLQETDVEQIVGGDDPVRLKLLLAGQVDGTTLVPPGLVEAQHQGMRLVVAGADLVPMPTFVLAATERKLAERPDQAVRLLRAFVRALRLIHAEGDGLAPVVADALDYDVPTAAEALRLVLDAYSQDGTLPQAELDQVLAQEHLDPSAVDLRFLGQAQQDVLRR